jgi:hypothetical protein
VFQPDYQAGTAPKLDVVAIDKALRSLGRLGIVGANQRLGTYEVFVASYDIRPILCHPRLIPPLAFGNTKSRDGTSI